MREASRRLNQRRLLTIYATERADSRPFGLMRLVLYAILRDVSGQPERPDTREVFEQTHRWMVDLQIFPEGQTGDRDYAKAVMV